jgi:hypothetical protein
LTLRQPFEAAGEGLVCPEFGGLSGAPKACRKAPKQGVPEGTKQGVPEGTEQDVPENGTEPETAQT